jgi:hypothetical protein
MFKLKAETAAPAGFGPDKALQYSGRVVLLDGAFKVKAFVPGYFLRLGFGGKEE